MRSLLHAPRSRRRSIAAAALGALALISSLLVATPASALNDTGTGGVFVPTTGRILDTKNNIGGYNTPMPAKTWRTVQVTGLAGLPDDGSVGAVSVVATVADISAAGQLFGRPDADTKYTLMGIYGGEQQQNTSFSSVLAVGADGTIQVYAETSARLILDVQGYYTANTDGTAPGGFVPLNGKRVADTRSGTGFPQAQLTTGKSAVLQVTGTAGVPAGASAVIVNLVAMNATSNVGFLTPYPTGAARPANSFNYAGSTTTTMQAQVQLSADGKITVYNANSTMDLAIDVQGYFTATGSSGAVFTPGSGRIFDTRATGNTILTANETRAIDVAGQQGVPVMGSGINSVVLTLTANAPNGSGWGRVWANGTSEPDTASLRYDNGTVRSNTITVPIGADGKVSLHNIGSGATNFIIDVQGWYTDPEAPTISCPTPYTSGAVAAPEPSTPINCVVTGPASSASGQTLSIVNDWGVAESLPLSETGTTSATVEVSTKGGDHLVFAQVLDTQETPLATTNYPFNDGGDWATENLLPNVAAHTLVNRTGILSVSPEDDTFPDGVSESVSIWNSLDTSVTPIWSGSAAVEDGVSIPEGVLTSGEKYYWNATVTGPSVGTPSATSRTTSTTDFVATDLQVIPACGNALLDSASAHQLTLDDDDWAKCAVDPSAQETSDSDGLGYVDPTVAQDGDSEQPDTSGGLGAGATVEASRAATTHTHSYTVEQSASTRLWGSYMKGKVAWNGSKAWSISHLCNVTPWAVGYSISLNHCGVHTTSKKSTVPWQELQVTVITKGFPISFAYACHYGMTKDGHEWKGPGYGF